MPTSLYNPSSEIESIVGIQFGIFSPEEIEQRAVVEITTQNTYEGNEPKVGGLFDPRMGVLENGKLCRSCGHTNHNCPGHFGFYRLARPVYFIQFLPEVLRILRCVCIRCSKLLINKENNKDILRRRGQARWAEVIKRCAGVKLCGEEHEDGCGAPQPLKYLREGGIAKILADFGPDAAKMPMEVEYVQRLFKRITDEDVDFMGFNHHWCRPDWMICSVLPVAPPQVRPSVLQDNNQRSEDDLTHKYFEIIKTNKILEKRIEDGASKTVIDEMTNVLQYHVATLVDNQIPGVAPSAQRSGRPLKSIAQRLGSKEGRIRYNIQGKRVEFSARSVITPDPNLSIAEIGVPMKIAMNLTFPERVTPLNKGKLLKYIQNGPNTYPGAKTIVRADGHMISLRYANNKDIQLYHGDIVNRHLIDGDILLFNRQPTLHRLSMMAHKIRVLPFNTFRMNVSVCTPYNADFDGDEMNAHIPQSYEAATELEEIAAVPHQMISPRHGKPIIGIVQDTLVGSYRLTSPEQHFNKREFMNLMMWNKRFNGYMPAPKAESSKYTGHQILSKLLPPINLNMKNGRDQLVKIEEGEVLEGVVDKDIYMAASRGITHVTYNDYGAKDTVALVDSLQNTIEHYLILKGFSVGISDLIADRDTKAQMDEAIQQRKKKIADILLQVHLDLFENKGGKTNQQEFEDQVFTELNKATDESGEIGKRSLAENNRMIAMMNAGSKGSITNVAQMIACVGQQNIEGRRIPYGLQDRTLPHYKKYDDGAEARGFIESSFIRGLTPQEFYFHAMSGREGLIDTAVKTADTGYIQRQLIKAMEDLTSQHDGTVRDANGNIVQYYYGEDGINATKIESINLGLHDMSEGEIRTKFGLMDAQDADVYDAGTSRGDDAELLSAYTSELLEDRKMIVEGMFRGGKPDGLFSSVNIDRLLKTIKIRFGFTAQTRTDLTPAYVLEGLKKIIDRTQSYHRLWGSLLRFHCAPHKLIYEQRFTRKAFDMFCEMVVIQNWKSWVTPGEQVGILAAQSIGEPSTQMTLNTFHLAGVASKSNVTRGVPRLKELLKATKNPKATSLTIYLKKEYRHDQDRAREVVQDLELTLLRDICNKVAIYYDPKDDSTVIEEDRELLALYRLFEMNDDAMNEELAAQCFGAGPSTGVKAGGAGTVPVATPAMSKWLLRVELSKEKMFDKNITMNDIACIVKAEYSSEIDLVYSDYNSQKLVMRIRIPQANEGSDSIEHLKKFQNKLLNGMILRGMPGIKSARFVMDNTKMELVDGKYQKVEQFVLETDGSNFVEVMNHPYVDGTKLYSTHVHDVFDVLGTEATRATLLSEMNTVFKSAGVNYRHLGLLCDMMTRNGKLISVDRYGINKNDIGPLAKASFEETGRILLRASLFGEMDPITGVSANIMAGQTIRSGTAFSQILLDEPAMERMMEGLPPQEDLEEEDLEAEDEALNELLVSAESREDACARTEFQMNVSLPPAVEFADEPEVEMTIVDE
jgi:DNA-directed RNA polymerase II subunit RPB1